MRYLLFIGVLLLLVDQLIAQNYVNLCLLDTKGQVLWQKEFPLGTKFGLKFTHSVAKTPVEDWFSLAKNQIFLEETIYQDFGAGLPFETASGQKMTFQKGQIILSSLHTSLKTFEVRVGRIANHTLLVPGQAQARFEAIPLKTLATPGQAITFISR
ncbi:MAG: DUF1850 domain-containing protein [Desulfovibrionaceae bacterium]|nr:DUF1850 domain-containing protein [Desulfovibrionaceae bacterium]